MTSVDNNLCNTDPTAIATKVLPLRAHPTPILKLLLLLLATTTWLWGLWGRHNSPPASYVISFWWLSWHGWHSPSIPASVFLAFFPQVVPSQESFFRRILAFLHLTVVFSTLSLSLVSSFLTWSLRVWPHAHLHIFISVTSSFFTWQLVLCPSRTALLTERSSCASFPSRVVVLPCRTGRLTSSSSYSIYTVSSCLFRCSYHHRYTPFHTQCV